jgi:ABC-type multidrug transport system fused ATPase/permease subunit
MNVKTDPTQSKMQSLQVPQVEFSPELPVVPSEGGISNALLENEGLKPKPRDEVAKDLKHDEVILQIGAELMSSFDRKQIKVPVGDTPVNEGELSGAQDKKLSFNRSGTLKKLSGGTELKINSYTNLPIEKVKKTMGEILEQIRDEAISAAKVTNIDCNKSTENLERGIEILLAKEKEKAFDARREALIKSSLAESENKLNQVSIEIPALVVQNDKEPATSPKASKTQQSPGLKNGLSFINDLPYTKDVREASPENPLTPIHKTDHQIKLESIGIQAVVKEESVIIAKNNASKVDGSVTTDRPVITVISPQQPTMEPEKTKAEKIQENISTAKIETSLPDKAVDTKPDLSPRATAAANLQKKEQPEAGAVAPPREKSSSSPTNLETEKHVDEAPATSVKVENPIDLIKENKTHSNYVPSLGEYLFSDIVGDSTRLMEKNVKVVKTGSEESAAIVVKKAEANIQPTIKKDQVRVTADGDLSKSVAKPSVTASVEPAKKKPGCCARIKALIIEKYNVIFFTHLNRFFGPNYLTETKKLNPMKDIDRMKSQVKIFMDIKTKKEKTPKYRITGFPLLRNLIYQIKEDLIWGAIFRILRQSISIIIPLFMKSFLDLVKKGKKVELEYSIYICLMVGALTLVRELIGQQASRYTSYGRKRVTMSIRYNLYQKLINANVEFLSKINPGFLSKSVLFDIDPIVEFICCLPALAAAPVTTIFAFIMIWLQFDFSWYFLLVLLFYIITLMLLAYLLSLSVDVRKKYRAISTAIHGFLSEYITNIKFIKINSLQNLLLKEIWKIRIKEVKMLRKLAFFDTIIDILLFSPTLATSLLIIGIDRAVGGNFDVVVMYTVIGALGSLRKPILAVSEAVDRYNDFKKSYQNYNILLKEVPDYPKLFIKKLPLKGLPEDDPRRVTYQHPVHMDPSNFPTELDDDFSVWFKNCTFFDKSKIMEQKVQMIFKEIEPKIKKEKSIFFGDQLILRKSNLKLKPRAKVCVMGSEYSGVENFFFALKKELELVAGEMLINGKVILYDKKRAHLIKEISFRDNIILDNTFDKEKFDEVCDALGLNFTKYEGAEYAKVEPHLNTVSYYDKLIILLARAFYQDFDIFCFFNFFNLLHYEDKIPFFEAIVEQYLIFNTVFFYSNDYVLAKRSDYIILIDDGRLVEQGTFKELTANPDSKFNFLMKARGNNRFQTLIEDYESKIDKRKTKRRNGIFGLSEEEKEEILHYKAKLAPNYLASLFSALIFMKKRLRFISKQRASKKAVVQEGKVLSHGVIGSTRRILSMSSRFTFSFVVLLILISGASLIFWDVWLGWWSTNFLNFPDKVIYFYYLIAISASITIYIFIRDVIINFIYIKMAHNMFMSTLDKVVRAEMPWFDYFKPSTIIYRMSADQAVVDNDLYRNSMIVIFNFLTGLMGLIAVNVVYPGLFAVITIIAGVYMGNRLKRYLRTAQIFISEWFRRKVIFYNSYVLTFNNILSLRHISKQRYLENYFIFVTEEFVRINSHAGTAGNRWLGTRISIALGFLAVMTYLCPVIQQYYSIWDFKRHIWILGFGLTWSQKTLEYFSDSFVGLVGMLNNLEASERVLELQMADQEVRKAIMEASHLDGIEGNHELESENAVQPSGSGLIVAEKNLVPAIELKNIDYLYRDKWVLKNLNMTVMQGEKLALVQISGTSIDCIFDLLLKFKIPNLDIDKKVKPTLKVLGKSVASERHVDLRRNFMVLKGDPVVFSGTLRDNVDPFRYFSDEEIVKVLHYLGFYKVFTAFMKVKNKDSVFRHIDTQIEDDNIAFKEAKSKSFKQIPTYDRGKFSLKSNDNLAREIEMAYNKMNPKPKKRQPCWKTCCRKKSKNSPSQYKFSRSRSDIQQAANKTVLKNRKLIVAKIMIKAIILLKKVLRVVREHRRILREENMLTKDLQEVVPLKASISPTFDMRRIFVSKKRLEKNEKKRNLRQYSKDDLFASKIINIVKTQKNLSDYFGHNNKQRFSKMIEGLGIHLQEPTNKTSRIVQPQQPNPLELHEIPNVSEELAIQRMLTTWISSESTSWNYPMKRIISIARAVLEKPPILLVEENALIIDHAWETSYLDGVFSTLKDSTILCEISSFKLIERFEYCSIFNANTIVETGKTKEMLRDSESELVNRLKLIDSRKVDTLDRVWKRRNTYHEA